MNGALERKLIAGFGLTTVMFALAYGVALDNSRQLKATDSLVLHTAEVLDRLQTVLLLMTDVETGVRGFVITGQPPFLEPYLQARSKADGEIQQLKTLTADNPIQQKRIPQLEQRVTSQLEYFDNVLRVAREDGLEPARQLVGRGEGKLGMGAIRESLREMKTEEEKLLRLRQQASVENDRRAGGIQLLLGLLILASLVGAYLLVRHHLIQRRRAETALRESEENLTVTLHSIGDAVLATDVEGLVTRMNSVAERLTGWSVEEARGRPIADVFKIVNEESREPAVIPVEAVLASGDVQGLANHTIIIARDGTERPIADSAAPIRDRNGKVVGVVLVFRDVTGEKQAQREIEVSSAKIHDLYNTAPCGYHSLNEDGVFVNINDTELAWLGYERDEVVGKKNFSEVLTESGQRIFETSFPLFKKQGWIKDLELECRAKDGSQFTALLNATVIRDPEGNFLASRATMFDITKRKQAEAERDRFFSLSLDMLCISNADGYFKSVNPAFTDTLGWSVAEMLDRPFIDFVHPDDRIATLCEVERQVVAGEPVLQFENRYQHKDGSWRVLSWKSIPYGEGMMYATARDVTERRRTEQRIQKLNEDLERRAAQLEDVNKELEAFSYSVSHDLRAPLRHVQGYVEMLHRAVNGQLSEKALRYLGVISDASREMSQLIDDLLSFSRMGRVGMHRSRVQLDGLVEDLKRDLELESEGRNIRWKIGELPVVLGDPSMLKQVLANLMGNAVKYTRNREAAEIEIGCAGDDEGRRIFFVKDNGAGFDMQYAHKLFGVFQRLHRADEFEGTGIGLAIVRRIIARHGGRTWAEAWLDQGATFYFTLQPDKNPAAIGRR